MATPTTVRGLARFSIAALLGLAALTDARADDAAPSAHIILDGSGSMWGQFDNSQERRAKIDIVRDLLRPILGAQSRARIGFQSYGHRRRGDCSDIEVMAAPTTDRSAVLTALDKLNPNGKGPLAESLRQATQAIGTQRPASIIVIHDGIDNCRQDACAAAAEFAKAAPSVPVHMIALAIPPAELPAVQCVAKATGGTFYDVRDPLALANALQDATTRAFGVDAEPQASEKGNTAEQAAAALPQAAVRATLALAEGGPPIAGPTTWTLRKKDSQEPLKKLIGPTLSLDVEPGDYTLTAERDGLSTTVPIGVEADKPVALALHLNAAQLTVKIKAPSSLPLIAVWDATEGTTLGRTLALQRAAGLQTVLPPGSYRIRVTTGGTHQEKNIKLDAGRTETVAFDAAMGSLRLTASLQEGAAPLADVLISIQEDDPDSPGGRREVARSRAPSSTFVLPAGTYYAVAQAGLAESRLRLALSAGDALEKVIVLAAAQVSLSASVGSASAPETGGLVFLITSLDGEPRQIARVAAPTFNGLLNAGRYRVAATLEKHGVGVTQDIIVEAGKPLTKVLRIEAGEVAFKGGATAAADAFWQLRDASGKAVWHAAAREPRVLLAPGRYSVRMQQRETTLEAAFAVSAGETKTIELGQH